MRNREVFERVTFSPDAQAKPRVEWVDAAKALAITLVVIVHATSWLRYAGIDSPELRQFNVAADSLRMPLFFLASGLFAAKWTQVSWSRLWTGKLSMLLWVFLVWQPVVFAYKIAAATWLPDQLDSSLAAHLMRVIASPVRPNGELWFLWALALAFTLARLTRGLPVWLQLSSAAAVSIVWTAAIVPALGEDRARVLGEGWAGIATFYVFFLTGLLLRRQIFDLAARLRLPTSLAILAGWVVLSVFAVHFKLVRDVSLAVFPILCLGVVAGVVLAALLARLPGIAHLGALTLPVYVMHTFVIVCVAVGIHLALPDAAISGWGAAAVILVVAAFAIAISLLVHHRIGVTWGRYLYDRPRR